MSNLIEVQDLCKYFHTPSGQLHAVDHVSVNVEERTTLGVVGESGCGKSTLGRMLVGLLDITSGNVKFRGQDITNPTRAERKALRRDIQMIFQDPYSSLDPRMRVQDLIAEPISISGNTKNRAEIEKKVNELMDTVGLARRFASSYPHELDGGRRQRIGIARALALNPRFIVCDAPVSALDVALQAQILHLLKQLQQDRGLTYLFITHNLSVVKHISHEIMVMYCGCMVEKCASQALFRQPLHPYTKGLLSAIPVASLHTERKRIVMRGEVSSPIDPKPGCRFAARCPYATDRCRTEMPALQELLPGHFTACHRAAELNEL